MVFTFSSRLNIASQVTVFNLIHHSFQIHPSKSIDEFHVQSIQGLFRETDSHTRVRHPLHAFSPVTGKARL
jgi:hypothetical protein